MINNFNKMIENIFSVDPIYDQMFDLMRTVYTLYFLGKVLRLFWIKFIF